MVNTNMYYEDNQDLAHDFQELDVNLLGLNLHFTTDAGVFSRSAIDYGSRVLLENFQPRGKSLLDLGCGYGPIGLSLAKKFGLEVSLSDVNPRALELASKNAGKNDLLANFIQSSAYSEIQESFDNIVTNPPIRAGKEVVHEILTGAFDHLNPGGQLLVVIQKKQGAPSAQKKMLEVFGNCEILARDRGYYILRSQR